MVWLDTIFDKLFSLFPTTSFVYPYEGGIRVTCIGKYERITDIKSGWYVIWPLIQYIYKVDVKPKAMDIRCQSAMTKDMKDITISGALLYRVYNPRKAIIEVMDYEKAISVIALGVIRKYVSRHCFEELIDMDNLTVLIRDAVHTTCTKWGIKIINVEITDFGRARNIRLLTNGNSGTMEFDE